MRLWVTRSQPGAASTADRLAALGHDPLVAPVLRIEPLPVVLPDLGAVSALAFTSAAGAAAFAARSPDRGLPVFAVGEATARAARGAGWPDVRSADGDGAALAHLIAGTLRTSTPGGRAGRPLVLAPGAREPAFDLVGALEAEGIAARHLPLYASAATPRPPAVAAALAEGALDGLLVHSAAAARALAAYAAADGVFAAALGTLSAFALSEACAAPLPPPLAASWPHVPREPDLLALLPLGARPALR